MRTRAAVALEAGKPLEIMEVNLEGPKAGEVLVEIKATGLCHTDEFTRSGADPEGLFPSILGHEGAGVVLEVGEGVTTLKPGDHVIPLYIPECRECKRCRSRKTNLCGAIKATQGKGLMPDGTSRFTLDGEPLAQPGSREGGDEDGKKWTVQGKTNGRDLRIDFSSRGGPPDELARADSIQIKFADGAVWKKL